jgi:hypothetical protein
VKVETRLGLGLGSFLYLEAVPSALAILSRLEAPEKGPEMTTFLRDETSK